MKYYKELKDDGKTVMSVSKVDEKGDMIVVCPYRSVTNFTHGEINNTATECTNKNLR